MKRLLKFLFTFLAFVLLVVGAWLLYIVWTHARSFDRLVAFGREAEQEFAQLEDLFPFEPPSPPQPAANDAPRPPVLDASGSYQPRWQTMLSVRQRAVSAVSPSLNSRVTALLESPDSGLLREASTLLAIQSDLEQVGRRYLAALREQQMGPAEYRWLLGVAMREAVEAPERFEAGLSYRRLIDRALRTTRAFAESIPDLPIKPEMVPTLDFALQTLRQEFGVHQAPPEVVDALRTDQDAAYLLDILAVSADWGDLEAFETETETAGGRSNP